MYEIIPSPGTEDRTFESIEKKLNKVKGLARTIHIDVIDGYYAKNKTFADPTPFEKYSKEFRLEIHLMVHDPIKHLLPWADIGASRFIGQIEKMPDQVEFIAEAERLGEASLGVDLDTPLDHIKIPFIDLDSILLMGVHAGFSGQAFSQSVLEKIRLLRDQTEIPIEIDGGINAETIKLAKVAGATRFVATSFIFGKEKSPKEQFALLEESLNS